MQSESKPIERQQLLFDTFDNKPTLDSRLWRGSFNGKESSIQQLSPYVGKMKSGMAQALINLYSQPGDSILDPFSGSGTVPFESLLLSRVAYANDLSPYAYVLTRGKVETPKRERDVLDRLEKIMTRVRQDARNIDTSEVPDWVKQFFHPDTLKETLLTFKLLKEQQDYFLTACMLGILHHIRPGFLSYPTSHLVPYLRTKKYPPEKNPKMYAYRDVSSRLRAKVKRAYDNSRLPRNWEQRQYFVYQENSMNLSIDDAKIDAIISSPPYFGALDYARDNRLRLWFLGCDDWHKLDAELTANDKVYMDQMSKCITEMERVLRSGGYCILVLGDVNRNGKNRKTAEILGDLAEEITDGSFSVETIYDDIIPDERRSRRNTKTTKYERILVMRKK